ncbi:MAG: AI-2E family transporter [Chloroflexota bacterium]
MQEPHSLSKQKVEQPSLLPDNDVQWDYSTKRIVLVILLIVTIFLVWLSRSVIPMLVISGIAAYVLKPIVDLAERIRIPRSIGTLVLYLLVLVAFILIPVIFVPILTQQLVSLIDYDPNAVVNGVILWTTELVRNAPENYQIDLPGFEPFYIPIGDTIQLVGDNFTQFVQDYIDIPTSSEILTYLQQAIGTATNVVGSATAIGVTIVSGIIQAFIYAVVVFIVSLYLTKDAPRISDYIQSLAPTSYRPELVDLLLRISQVWHAFFRGQLALSIIIGFSTWLTLYLVGMPGALILGIVAGIMEIIPNLGPVLAMVPAVIIALIQGSTNPALVDLGNFGFSLMVVGIYFLIQQIENSVIVPRIIGDSVNLHPIVIICGVIIGFSIAGILGAFLAAPIIATLRVVGSYVHAKLLDYPPFPEDTHKPRRISPRFYRRVVTGKQLQKQAEEEASQPSPAQPVSAPVQSNQVQSTSEEIDKVRVGYKGKLA